MTEELELLKKAWKNDTHSYEQVTENQIYDMIHKRSSSIVKWILVISLLGYGIIGFLDDGIKLYYKRNLGLRAWQKLALQIIIAVVIVLIASSDHFQFGLYIPLFVCLQCPKGSIFISLSDTT